MIRIACSWSGGKDSCYALGMRLKEGAMLKALVNMMNENGKISRSHGLPLSVLQQQADAIGVPLLTTATSWNEYEKHFVSTINSIVDQYGVEEMVFGDIDLQEHRDWEEMVCAKAGIKACLPIWKQDRRQLVENMISGGIEAVIVSCNEMLGSEFLGKQITYDFLPEFESKGVDVCGENGEYHTVVVNAPFFKQPINLPPFEKVLHNNYWFLSWEST
jgi:uncharacterized protein (TIGR00290 family)